MDVKMTKCRKKNNLYHKIEYNIHFRSIMSSPSMQTFSKLMLLTSTCAHRRACGHICAHWHDMRTYVRIRIVFVTLYPFKLGILNFFMNLLMPNSDRNNTTEYFKHIYYLGLTAETWFKHVTPNGLLLQ